MLRSPSAIDRDRNIPSLSGKDFELISKTFRRCAELFYENKKNEAYIQDLICLTSLFPQIISTKASINGLTILSQVEVLRAKAKGCQLLIQKIDAAIDHLRKPCFIPLQYQNILYALQKNDLFTVGCTIAIRFFQNIVGNNKFDWTVIIDRIGQNISASPTLGIQLLYQICKGSENHCKLAVKSGVVRFIFLNFLPSLLKDKLNIYKSIKLIKLIANSDKSILKDRQKVLSNVIYSFDDYIPLISDVCLKCYDAQYCGQLANKEYDNSSIDQLYLWSYIEIFCQKNISQAMIENAITMCQKIPNPEIQAKLLAIFSNYCKYCKFYRKELLKMLPHHQEGLLNYLKMSINLTQIDNNSVKLIDWNNLQKLVQINTNAKVQQLYKYLKQMTNKQIKVNSLNQTLTKVFSLDKNVDFMIERAAKVPHSDQQLEDIRHILMQKSRANQFDSDNLFMVKEKAIESLQKSIIRKTKLPSLNNVIQSMELNDVTIVAKMLTVLELNLMMNEDAADSMDISRILEMIQWIEDHYQGEIIDWGSIRQLLIILCEKDEWKNHLKQVPKKCFWLLDIEELSEQEQTNLFNFIQNLKKTGNEQKLPLIIGFLGKILSPEQKLSFLQKFPSYFEKMSKNLNDNIDYKTNLMMLSYFIKGWHLSQEDDSNSKSHNRRFQKFIESLITIVLNNFRSLPQENYFLESCLPFGFNIKSVAQNLQSLITKHGKLSSYLYKQQIKSGKKQLAPIKNTISRIASLPPPSILETLIFLQKNDDLISDSEVQKLIDSISSKKNAYWQLYPNYVNIMSKVIQLFGQTENPNLTVGLSDIVIKTVNEIQNNKDITEDERDDLFSELKQSFESMKSRGVYIEIERVKSYIKKIVEEQVRQQIIIILNNYKCKEPQRIRRPKIQVNEDSNIVNPHDFSISRSEQKEEFHDEKSQQSPSLPSSPDFNDKLKNQSNNLKEVKISGFNYQPSPEVLKKEDLDSKSQEKIKPFSKLSVEESFKLLIPQNSVISIESSVSAQKQEFPQSEDTSIQSKLAALRKRPTALLHAFQLLYLIVKKKEPMQRFKQIDGLFRNSQLNEAQMQLFGELISQFYIEYNCPKALEFCLDKTKTNIAKEQVYRMIKAYKEAFVLSRRWKLFSRQGLDIAMIRIREGFFAQACQVAQYNLPKTADIQYFYSKRYNGIVSSLVGSALTEEDVVNYLLLVGTSARLPQIRKDYLQLQLNLTLMQFLKKYSKSSKVLAALCYALSSLVYQQPQASLQVVRQKQLLKLILDGIRRQIGNRALVDPGVCLIANLTYSNSDVKQVLRNFQIIELLMRIFENSTESQPQISTLKQLLRAMGNLSISKPCAQQLVKSHFCQGAVKMAENLDIFVSLDDKKSKVVKLLIDLISNISNQKCGLEIMHREKLVLLIVTLLQTMERNPQILMGCIDTVDALCQNQEIEHYLVSDKRLPFILIDILKIQEDPNILLKATRLITNLTLHPPSIPHILKSNLLGVVANVVLPHTYSGSLNADQIIKIEGYVRKMLTRIHQSKPNAQTLLKSGFLECLLRALESMQLQDSLLELLFNYSQHLPNFLSKRAFFCLIRILIEKVTSPVTLQKCIQSFKNVLSFSYDRDDEEELVASSICQMYEKLLESQNVYDALFLLGFHLLRSRKLRTVLRKKQDNVLSMLNTIGKTMPAHTESCNSLIFLIFNPMIKLWLDDFGPESEAEFYKVMRNGFKCQLYRTDGSHKQAILDMDEEYNLRAYKAPDGEIKKKYVMNVRYIKDLQIDYAHNEEVWKHSPFNLEKSMFDSHNTSPALCATLVGNSRWGEITFINIQFQKEDDKMVFYRALSQLIAVFRG